jgi:hypothetical protein
LFTYYIENPLVIISISSGSWREVMVIGLELETWVKVVPKRGWGEREGEEV